MELNAFSVGSQMLQQRLQGLVVDRIRLTADLSQGQPAQAGFMMKLIRTEAGDVDLDRR